MRGVPSNTTKRSSPSSTSAPSSDASAVSSVIVASLTLDAGHARSSGVNTSVLRLLHVADPATARRMGEAGRARVEAEFSWGAIADRTRAIYDELLG